MHYRYNGKTFTKEVKKFVAMRKVRGIGDKTIRHRLYRVWALQLRKKNIGPKDAKYAFPSEALAFVRELAPVDIQGKIRPDAYEVDMLEFAEAIVASKD